MMTTAHYDAITGRYMRIKVLGQEHRIYVEESGEGIPLLCLHTAGSDSRQYRAVLNDEQILRHHRVIAFDMPWHGKSSPPSGWQEEDYALTTDSYIEIVLSVMDALELERPIVVGCSIGGRVVLHLARRHPERLGAVVGLQSGAHVDPYYDLQWLHRPDVHGGLACAGIVSGLIAPQAPEDERWETLWHYMQSGPGVFKGDLHFYKKDGDIRQHLAEINTDRCPVYLLSGEYDYSCTPEDTRDAARAIRGSQFTIMPGLGHFPMSEDSRAFLGHFRPTLSEARNARAVQAG